MHDMECVADVTDYFPNAFVRENVARVYMTLWRRNDGRKLTLTPFCFEKSVVSNEIFNVKIYQVKYARITITHVCFIALTLAASLGRCLNTRPNGLVFKQLPQDRQMLMHEKTCVILLFLRRIRYAKLFEAIVR